MQRQGFAPYFYGDAKRWATRGDGSVSAEGVYRFDVGCKVVSFDRGAMQNPFYWVEEVGREEGNRAVRRRTGPESAYRCDGGAASAAGTDRLLTSDHHGERDGCQQSLRGLLVVRKVMQRPVVVFPGKPASRWSVLLHYFSEVQ
jgi:hypothetical protein